MSENLDERLKDMELKRTELENLISEKKEKLHQRASNFKQQLEDRVNPEEIIRNNPVTSVGASFGVGFVIGALIKRSGSGSGSVSTKPPRPSSASYSKKNPDKNFSRIFSEFSYDLFDAFKDVAITAIMDYASSKLSEVTSKANQNQSDSVNR